MLGKYYIGTRSKHLERIEVQEVEKHFKSIKKNSECAI